MAKFDHGGGCPCGLYAECGDDCHYPKGTTAEGTVKIGPGYYRVAGNFAIPPGVRIEGAGKAEGAIAPSGLYSGDRFAPVAEHPEDVWIRDMFAEPRD